MWSLCQFFDLSDQTYVVSIKINKTTNFIQILITNKHIQAFPFVTKISTELAKRYSISVGQFVDIIYKLEDF